MNNENREYPTTFFTPRHTRKTKPTEGSDVSGDYYPGITPEGEEIVRERTRNEILELVEQSAPGSVVIYGGSSDYIRTKSSSRVSGNELKHLLADQSNKYMVLDESDIHSLVEDPSGESMRKAVQEVVAENPDKKIVLIYPLYVEELSMDRKSAGRKAEKERWTSGGSDNETHSEYLKELLKQSNQDGYEAVTHLIENNGIIKKEDETQLKGPLALDIAKDYLTAIKRLEATAKKLFPDRPLVIEATGHSWSIDIFVAYLATGRVDKQTFQEIAQGTTGDKTIISDFEFPVIKVEKGRAEITYRGKTYPVSPELIN